MNPMRNQYMSRDLFRPLRASARIGLIAFCLVLLSAAGQCQRINFNHGWQFYKFKAGDVKPHKTGLYDTSKKGFSSQFTNEKVKTTADSSVDEIEKKERLDAEREFKTEYPSIPKNSWQSINLPHTANIEPLVPGPDMWQGVAYYKKQFALPAGYRGRKVTIMFEGAMQQSDVWVNGKLLTQHKGGYTPFYADCTSEVFYDKPNIIVVRVDNRPNKNFPPGKPFMKNGYNYWSGIYRNAWLVVTDKIHITDPVQVDREGSGGVFFRTPEVSQKNAVALIKANVINESRDDANVVVEQTLKLPSGEIIAVDRSSSKQIAKAHDVDFEQHFDVKNPKLWSPDIPNLYTLQTSVFVNGKKTDEVTQRVGFRKLEFSRKDGFRLNGQPLKLIGVNRHQEYPYIGAALSDNAEYRDLKKIKEAGFNTVRLSHYPQDPSVYDAADELGLMLLDAIPGWQFYSKSQIFKERVFRDIRDMIHRDRNHPSVILWEANLNESYPPDSFRNACHQLVDKELPVGEYFTIGETYGAKHTEWDVAMSNWYDDKDTIFRNTYERVQDIQPNSPGFIKEYADWEYGGVESTTRCTRADGEQRMLRGLWNTLWEHNTDLDYEGNVGDAIWAMYDNNIPAEHRNYEWGVSDYFRLPKFVGPLFRSQLEPYKKIAGVDDSGPYLFVANWWTPRKGRGKVIVLSNCDEVVLKVNGKTVATQKPDSGPTTAYGLFDKGGANPFDGGNCRNYAHPPFTFKDILYEPGELKAEGYIKGKKVAEQIVSTPAKPVKIKLQADFSGKPLKADGTDAIFVYASLVDKNGTVACLNNESTVNFFITGRAKIIGPSRVKVRGGIATILVQSGSLVPGTIKIDATAQKKLAGSTTIVSQKNTN
jgi:beta-galactosidase